MIMYYLSYLVYICFYLEEKRGVKVVGGEEVTPHSLPWQVAIVDQQTTSIQCGGTILCSKYILTAAHCFDPKYARRRVTTNTYQVLVGAHNIHDKNVQRFDIEAFFNHPDWE